MRSAGSEASRDPFDRVAESFLEQYRRGERPSLSEYVRAYPDLADDIRDLIPALVQVESLKDDPNPPAPAARAGRCELTRLGDYQVLGVVGEGGMGIVYEAVRESLRSRVALKVMHPRYRDRAGYVRRFQVEARAAARLHHTNIVSVFDYGTTDDVVYYAMPYIEGQSLDKVLEDVRRMRSEATRGSSGGTPRPSSGLPASARTLALPTTAVVASAGRSGPTPLAAGLLSGRFDEADPSEEAGVVPEPSRRQPPSTPEAPADSPTSSLADKTEVRYYREVARLGVQVAEAVAYAHDRGVLHRDIKPSNLLLDRLGNAWVTDFGLAKFEDSDDLSESKDLLGTLRYMAPERFNGVSGRGSDIYALGATLYELLALRPVFAGTGQAQIMHQIANEVPTPLRRHDRRIPRDLATIVMTSLAKHPRDRFATAGDMAAELQRFVEYRPIRSRAAPSYERLWRWSKRNPAMATLVAVAGLLTIALTLGATVAAWTFLSQRDELAAEKGVSDLSLRRATRAEVGLRDQLGRTQEAERQARLALGRSLLAEGVALQGTGRIGQRTRSLDRLAEAARLLRDDPEGLALIPEVRDRAIAALGRPDLVETWRRPFGDWSTVACDPSLRHYAEADLRSGDVLIRRLRDGAFVDRLPGPGPGAWYAPVAFSPDGQYLHVYLTREGNSGELLVWHLGRREQVLRRPARGFAHTFHPDGRRFLFAPPGEGVVVWDLVDRREVSRLPLSFVAPNSFALDPAGTRLACNDQQERSVRVLDLGSGREVDSWSEASGRNMMAWSADGRLLAVGDFSGQVTVRDVANRRLSSVLLGHTGAVFRGEFYPVGPLLATSGWDLSMRLWDASTGEPLVAVPRGALLGFSRDGRELAYQDGRDLHHCEVAHGRELMILNPVGIGNRTEVASVDDLVLAARYSPDGRLLALATRRGIHLHDASSGRELAILDAGECHSILFDREGRNLICYGRRGLQRWPIAADTPGALRIGPPTVVLEVPGNIDRYRAAWLPDGRTVAALDNSRGRVVIVDVSTGRPQRGPARELSSGGNRRMTSLAVSPDGRWAAAGGWKERGICVWDLSAGRLDRVLQASDSDGESSSFVAFAPDGRLLARTQSAAAGHYAWAAPGWERSAVFEGIEESRHEPVFSADGTMMALHISREQIRLADAATGRAIAHLSTQEPLDAQPLSFSPDGGRLVAITARRTAIAWDLHLVRDRLKGMGLDWERPPLATRDEPGPAPSVRVVGAVPDEETCLARLGERIAKDADDADALGRRGAILLARGRFAEAIVDLERARALTPRDAIDDYALVTSLNNLAWDQAMGPADRRDPDRAVSLAARAVELLPGRDGVLNTLGVSLYRAGRYRDAVPALERSLREDRAGLEGFDLLFLAMAHHRLGRRDEARAAIRRAEEWSRTARILPSEVQSLREVRSEALATLETHTGELPADVFARPRPR